MEEVAVRADGEGAKMKINTLSVTFGDSSPRGRASILTSLFTIAPILASPYGRGGGVSRRRGRKK